METNSAELGVRPASWGLGVVILRVSAMRWKRKRWWWRWVGLAVDDGLMGPKREREMVMETGNREEWMRNSGRVLELIARFSAEGAASTPSPSPSSPKGPASSLRVAEEAGRVQICWEHEPNHP